MPEKFPREARPHPNEILRHDVVLSRLIQLRVGKSMELTIRPTTMSPDLTRRTILMLDNILTLMVVRSQRLGISDTTLEALDEMKRVISISHFTPLGEVIPTTGMH